MKKQKKKKRIWLRTIVIIVGILIIADVGITLYFYKIAAIRNNTPASQVKKSSPNYSLVQAFDKLSKTTKTITDNNIKLDAWYVPATKKTNKTVIVVHGFRQDKSGMRQYGELFHELGYNVLMPDNRGAGSSGGRYISYGYYDKNDVIKWADDLINDNKNSDITLYGLSMGAATVMMASGEKDLPKQVSSIIEDCGYSSVWKEIVYQGQQGYHLPPFPLIYSVSLENKIRQGWFFQEGDADKSLTKDTRPILLIHGNKDTYVPTSMVYDNYRAVKKGTPKELLVVKGAIHARSFETNPGLYRTTVAKFMQKYNPT